MKFLFLFVARLPLWVIHIVGRAAGWATYWASPTYRRRFIANAATAGFTTEQVRPAVGAAGCMALEAPRLWFGQSVPVQWPDSTTIDSAWAQGRGIVFLTPHLGCFEITVQSVAKRYAQQHGPIAILYRKSRQPALESLLAQARQRQGQVQALPANASSVRKLLKALRSGQAIGLLPDQVPAEGQGLWAPFFDKPAYTMTLAAKLAQQTKAPIVLIWGERLAKGAGYRLHIEPFDATLSEDLQEAVTQINAAMQRLIEQCPGQYLWGYGRYKTPRQQI